MPEMNRKERRKLAKLAGNPKDKAQAARLMADGLALAQSGKPAEAIEVYEKALVLDEKNTNIHYVLGVLYKQLGKSDVSVEHYKKSVAIEPANANAWYNLGNGLAENHQLDDAVAAYQQAVKANPSMALAWTNMGNALKARGAFSQALQAYQESISIDPKNVDTLFNLGEIQRSTGALDDAVTTFEKALEIDPSHLATLNNLGSTLRDLKQFDQSIRHLLNATQLSPQSPMGFVNLANTYRDLGRYEDAFLNFEVALKLDPESSKAHSNFGNLLQDMELFPEARQSFQKALVSEPEFAEGHYNLGLFDLLEGAYSSGWEHFNWRWIMDAFKSGMPSFAKPLWEGQSLEGKTLLLWDEQGVGDTLLFTSLIPELIEKKCRLKLLCDPRLIPLITRSFPGVECTPKSEAGRVASDGGGYDFHAPVGNLGGVLRSGAATFPERSSFLVADPDRVSTLRQRYQSEKDQLLVGIAWHSKGPESGPKKSIALSDLKPVLEIPGIKFIDLQYGDTHQQRQQLQAETGIEIFHDDGVDQLHDIDLFAAQTKAMDLVVTISNTTAHMAGGLGVPTVLMLCRVPIWYWMMERSDNPWYPSLKLFRQSRSTEWSDVIEAVAREIRSRVETHSAL